MELHTAKEELENNLHDAIWDSVYSEGGEVAGGNKAVEKCVYVAVEYSRLVACEFTKWICSKNNGWFILNPDEGIWGNLLTHETKTTEQLFDEFIKEYGK